MSYISNLKGFGTIDPNFGGEMVQSKLADTEHTVQLYRITGLIAFLKRLDKENGEILSLVKVPGSHYEVKYTCRKEI